MKSENPDELAEFPGYVLSSLGLSVFGLFWFDDEGEVQHLYLVLVPCGTLVTLVVSLEASTGKPS